MDKKQHFIFVIDDTGFNKREGMAPSLKKEIATSCVAIIQAPLVEDIQGSMDVLVERLKKRFPGATEFHFTEIYNHSGPFEKISFDETLDIIDMFNYLLKMFGIEIITGTLSQSDDKQTQENKEFLKDFCKNYLNLPVDKTNGDKSLTLLNSIFMAKKYLEENYDNPVIDKIICDEGLRKKGFKANLKLFDKPTTISFESSKENSLLQIADYAAWYITRQKNTLGDKTSLNQNAQRLMQALADGCDSFVNLSQVVIDTSNFNYEDIHNELK